MLSARARPRRARVPCRLRAGLGAAGHRSGRRRDRRARACRRAGASAHRCPAEPRQGAVRAGPRGRGGRRLPCSARGERRLPPSLRPRHGDPRSSFRHARRRSRGAPRFRRERSALAALPLLRGTQPGPPPRRLPLVVLPFGQLDEAGLGPRQRARPHRLRSPPPLGRDGGGVRGRRIPAGSPRHVRGHPGTRQRTGRRAHRRRRARCPRRPQRLQRAPPATRRRLPPGPRRRGMVQPLRHVGDDEPTTASSGTRSSSMRTRRSTTPRRSCASRARI